MMDGFAEMRFMPGVLFAEDFDEEPPVASAGSGPAHAPQTETTSIAPDERPRYSEIELTDATAIARDEGARIGHLAALEGVEAKRLVLVEHAVASLADARAAALATLEDECGRIAATALTLLLGFLPCIAERFAIEQVRSTLLDLVGTLVEPGRVTIALHPDLLADVEPALSASAAEGAVIALLPDAAMVRGDVAARWRNGCARRDTAALRRTMRDALAEAGLLDQAIADHEEDARHGS